MCNKQGSRESSRGSGKIYVVTALIEYLTVLLKYIDLFGAHKQSGAQGKMPQLPPPPPLGGPGNKEAHYLLKIFYNMHLKHSDPVLLLPIRYLLINTFDYINSS